LKKILLTYNYFHPAYKAGGPIQSCANLVRYLHGKYDFLVFTRNSDLGSVAPLQGIEFNTLTNFEGKAQVFYHGKEWITLKNFKKLLQESNPDIIYINGIYNWDTVVIPILAIKFFSIKIPLIIAPRGMFQNGALSLKPIKKKIFLFFFKFILPKKNISWHATDSQEKEDIKKQIDKNALIKVIPNIPSIIRSEVVPIMKSQGELKIVTISLITEKKNLLLTLKSLKNINGKVIFDIFGPIKDFSYWEKCKDLIDKLDSNISVNYKGDRKHEDVQDILENYHFFVLPTKGENFGHSIFESFSVYRPVITSKFTPWKALNNQRAGWNVDIESTNELSEAITLAINMNQATYNEYVHGSGKIAYTFWETNNFMNQYTDLFNTNKSNIR
jgi:glycosyltransferase involved in cell wall biosynthesis